MATASTAALLVRVREVLQGGFGELRTIVPGTYVPGFHEEQGDAAKSFAAIPVPRVEVRPTSIARNVASPSVIGSFALYDVELEVAIVRHLNQKHRLSSATRDEVMAAATADGDVVAQALSFPDSLTTTEAGVDTGLCSGLLTYGGSELRVSLVDGAPGVVESTHKFSGIVRVNTAIA